jgi:hypothetical protein
MYTFEMGKFRPGRPIKSKSERRERVLSVRLTEAVYIELTERAAADKRSVSNYCEMLIEAALWKAAKKR